MKKYFWKTLVEIEAENETDAASKLSDMDSSDMLWEIDDIVED